MKKPIQVYLRPEQLETLRRLAGERKVPVAALIREGIDRMLAEIPVEQDPLWGIIGLADGGPGDLAENHDRYIAEMVAAEDR